MNMNAIMNYGTLYGILIIVTSLVFYILGFEQDNTAVSIINLVITIGGLFFFMNKYKSDVTNGFISFSKSFRSGILISLFGAILSGFYNWIFMSFIDPGVIDKAKETAYERAISGGQTEEQAIAQLEMAEPFMTPIGMTLTGLVFFIIIGLILSAIIAAFIKKDNPNPFEEA